MEPKPTLNIAQLYISPRSPALQRKTTKPATKSQSYRPKLILPTAQDETPNYQSKSGRFVLGPEFRVGKDGIQRLDSPKEGQSSSKPSLEQQSNRLTSPKNLDKIEFEDLEISKEALGSGTSASVRRCIHVPSGRIFALKEIVLDHNCEMKPKVIISEFKALKETEKCPYIITMYDAFHREGSLHMLLEFMDCGSLADIVKSVGKIPEKILSHIAHQLTVGVNYLHERSIVHRDIKPENILINSQGICKLADFGMAGTSENGTGRHIFKTFQGTTFYMSPERIKGEEHSFDSDIWSLGLSIAELALGELPKINNFWDLLPNKEEEVANNVCKFIVDLPSPHYSEELRHFVGACMKIDPMDRAKAAELLQHPFIKKFKANNEFESSNTIKCWLKSSRGVGKKIKSKRMIKNDDASQVAGSQFQLAIDEPISNIEGDSVDIEPQLIDNKKKKKRKQGPVILVPGGRRLDEIM